jgi:ubiquinone/menaquinone biosynthesis C-methylase UbiE/glycosyltransferase involved in cell wall biosynthesis
MRLAYFSPLHPLKSGISKYSEDLLPYLAKYAEIDLYLDDYQPSNQTITSAFKIYPYPRYYELAATYDIALYHLGNNAYHRYLYPFTITHPGITILHDFILFHLLAGITYVNWDVDNFTRDMQYNHGEAGRLAASRFLSGTFSDIDKFQFPMNKEIIESSLGVVVHSDYYNREITEHYPNKPVATIPMHIGKDDYIQEDSRNQIREQLGFNPENIILASFGFISPIKHIDIALRAVAKLVKEFPQVRYVLVGESNHIYNVRHDIQTLHLQEFVRVTEFVDEKTYNDYLNIVDISINLRYPSAGETSLTLHQSFAAGIPTLVSNYRQYAEYPDACCLKIDLSPNEEDNLIDSLRRLITNESLRKELGMNARNYVTNTCTLELVAQEYISFIEKVMVKSKTSTIFIPYDRTLKIKQRIADKFNEMNIPEIPHFIKKETEFMTPYRDELEFKKKMQWDLAAEEVAKKYDPVMSTRIPLVWNWPKNMSGRFIYDFSVVALSLDLPVNSRILDVAAGSCWVSEWLHQLGFRTVAFDISPTQLTYGKKRFETNPRLYQEFSYGFVCADGERLPFPNESFDGIVCLNSFHHMPNFQKVLSELYRILKPNGRAVFSEPGADHATSELSKREMQEYGTLEKNVVIDEVHQLAQAIGFKHMVIKPVVYPDSVGYTYPEWKQFEAQQPEKVNQFVTHIAKTVYQTHPIFILYKGEIVIYDSRIPNLLKAEINLITVPNQIKRGQPVRIKARVKNIGDTIWLHKESRFGGYVRFGIKLTTLEGQLIRALKQADLVNDIQPQSEFEIAVELNIDADSGKYLLKFDMVDEQVCWFADSGSKEISFPIAIVP